MGVSADYDPLLGKLVVWGEDRIAAIARMAHALTELRVLGVTTNLAFLQSLVTHPAFGEGATDTGFIPRHFPHWATPPAPVPAQLAAVLALALARPARSPAAPDGSAVAPTPWQALGAWSNT